MLSINLLEKYFGASRFERILEGVLDNGLQLPLPLRIRLSQSHLAAAALGLRRVVELTYLPTSLSRAMTQMLLDEMEAGSDAATAHNPLVTACTAAALGKVMRDHRGEDDPALVRSYHRAMTQLNAMQHEDGLFFAIDDRDDQQRALSGAFILWLLADDDAFRQSVRISELLGWFEDNADNLDRDTRRLWMMARVSFMGYAERQAEAKRQLAGAGSGASGKNKSKSTVTAKAKADNAVVTTNPYDAAFARN